MAASPPPSSLSLRAGRRGLGDGNAVRKEGGASCQSTATTACSSSSTAARRRCGYCGFAQGTCHLSMSARRNICTYAHMIQRASPHHASCIMHHADVSGPGPGPEDVAETTGACTKQPDSGQTQTRTDRFITLTFALPVAAPGYRAQLSMSERRTATGTWHSGLAVHS